ncbi:hypothetical protein TARUN_8166 [Trichoderma arundinaceum]|uniref:Uncharacterized protein n=1 Tax=Trichoderma arundinaceum TaxID=490622 RepID=A0A395NE35_TRIAR|nr:hypothetical protein TARUN_8166 [Trichoderma arundinaceum]
MAQPGAASSGSHWQRGFPHPTHWLNRHVGLTGLTARHGETSITIARCASTATVDYTQLRAQPAVVDDVPIRMQLARMMRSGIDGSTDLGARPQSTSATGKRFLLSLCGGRPPAKLRARAVPRPTRIVDPLVTTLEKLEGNEQF